MVTYSLFLAIVLNNEIQNCVVYAEDPDTTGKACVENVARNALDRIIVGDYPAYLQMGVPVDTEQAFSDMLDAASDLIDERKSEIYR